MALSITTKNITNDNIDNYCINEEDIELAQEVGILNQTDDFENMITNEEEYLEDLDQFIYELEVLSQSSDWFECEGIYTNNYVYKDVPVRVNIKKANYAFGGIDGVNNVYIPKSLLNKITTNEIVSMDLIYKECDNNCWKAIRINDKKNYKPVLVNELIIRNNDGDDTYSTYHIPFQDIGKMIGKNGNILKKVIKDYLINNQDEIIYFNPEPLDWTNFDEWYENANITKLDINNTCIEYTEVKVYYKIKIGRMRFDPIQDFLMKLYY